MPEVPLENTPAIDPKVEEAVKNQEPMPGLEKFWDEDSKSYRNEDIQKSYLHLQKMQGSKDSDPDTPDLTIEKPTEPEAPTEEPEVNAETVVSDAGLDMEALQQEYAEKGELSRENKDAILEQLKPLGVDESGLDLYLKAQADQQTALVKEIHDLVGGEEEYRARLEWAKDNMSPDEIQAFDSSVNESKAAASLAVQGLDARYKAAVGAPPASPVNGRRSTSGGVKPFASQMEMSQATMDPRYQKDESYRREVEQRVASTLRHRG